MNPRLVGREQAAEMGYDEAIPGLGGEGFEGPELILDPLLREKAVD